MVDDLKTIVEKIYKDFNPDKISNISSLIEKYKGKESEMLSKMTEKYNIRLFQYITIDPFTLVAEILQKHDPVNISAGTSLLAEYKNRENDLWTYLSNKFNSNFNEIVISIYLKPSNESFVIDNQTALPISFENNLQRTTPKIKKTNNLLIIGIPVLLIITIVLILCVTGVFSSHKKTNDNLTSTTNSTTTTNNTDSNSKTSADNDYQTKVLATINSYYSDLNNKTFEATKYFADKVDRFITMLNTTPADINNNINTSFYKEFRESKSNMLDSAYTITKEENDNYSIDYIEYGECFRTSLQQFRKAEVRVKVILNADFKIKSFYEYLILKNEVINNGTVNINSSIQKYVTAANGLFIRELPSINQRIITIVPYTKKVFILETGNPETINNISGNWVKVKWGNFIGWSFDGYLR